MCDTATDMQDNYVHVTEKIVCQTYVKLTQYTYNTHTIKNVPETIKKSILGTCWIVFRKLSDFTLSNTHMATRATLTLPWLTMSTIYINRILEKTVTICYIIK